LVQSVAMPVAVSGSNDILTAAGNGNTEGLLTLSTNGQYLVLTGYNAPVGTIGVGGTPSDQWSRTIGLVKYDATINTSTALTDLSSGAFVRCAVSTNGSDIWACGAGTANSTGGVRYATVGATTSTQLNSAGTGLLRCLYIARGQLYVSGTSSTPRIGTVGTGLPTTTGQTITNLPGLPETILPGQFILLDLDAGIAGVDVLYFTNDNSGIQKYSLVSGSWVSNGTVGVSADDYRSLTPKVSGTTVTLYATRRGANSSSIKGGQLVSLTDASGYNGAFSATPVVLANATTNQAAFRGVAPAPVQAVLPIKLIHFAAGKINKDVQLKWEAAEATNFSHFEVERSIDGITFPVIGKIDLQQTSNSNTEYRFSDAGILNTTGSYSVLYYRLKMVDKDGHVEYSKIITVIVNENKARLISAYPDPFINEIFVKISVIRAGNVNVSLIDARGKLVKSLKLFLPPGENTISLSPPPHLQKGIYMLRVHVNDKVTSIRLLK
ncbi:MAG TPA: T9SS type A sorting domain-containing protein, partial [Niastella sp.]